MKWLRQTVFWYQERKNQNEQMTRKQRIVGGKPEKEVEDYVRDLRKD